MTVYLKQSTASQEVPLGIFVDSTDGVTAETGLTIANTDIKLHKAGATTLANKNSGGATHISGGIYYAVLDATDTDTLGSVVIYVQVAGALPVRLECVVLAANVYDSLIGGGDLLQVDTTQISGDSTAADNLEAAADGTGYNLGGGSVVAASVTGAVGSVTGSVGGNVTGSVGSVTGAVGSVTGNVGGNVTGSIGSLATQAKADVNAEVVDTLSTDTYAEPGSVPAASASLAAKIGWLFTLGRNKITQTATTTTVRNDADSGSIATSTVSDDATTFTRSEFS